MDKRSVIRMVLDGQQPPYVPWSFGLTREAKARLQAHYSPGGLGQGFGAVELEDVLGNHLLKLGNDIGFFTDLGHGCVQDVFGVVWDRSVDKNIGMVSNQVLPEPTLRGYAFPNPLDRRFFENIPAKLERYGERFRVFQIGFSLYERAWTMRGLQTLMVDFFDHPAFVDELLNTIADYNLAQVQEALRYDIDAVYFGDDWGQQRGLQMGPRLWRRFIYPALKRMYSRAPAR